jgi:subtilisin family serine protease
MQASRVSLAQGARRLGPALAAALGVCSWAASSRAEVDLGAFVRGAGESRALPRVFGAALSVVTEVPLGSQAPPGFSPIAITRNGTELGVLNASRENLPLLVERHPELRFEWSPPFRLLLERADGWIGASSFRNTTGLSGRGTLIGIVDTGVDPTHPDLRGPDGAARIRYWLDFSRGRADLHPELEDEVGCGSGAGAERTECAVFDGDDVDALVANDDAADDPRDGEGHGTHVASLAAGSGLSLAPARYVGVAPEAGLIVVRVTRRDGGIYDADILKAVRFVFERARELGLPAVVNLSLGSDFGGHDGTSPIERGLESLVGPEFPGRAIVVAAGNSAGLHDGLGTGAPEPLGVHTEVHVPEGASALVPIITPPSLAATSYGTIYAWIAARPGDALALGVEDASGTLLEPVPFGSQGVAERGELEIVVVNGAGAALGPVGGESHGAVVMLDGRIHSGEVFGLRLEGPVSANIWLQGEGDFHPDRGFGPLVPRATKDGTINVPATSPALIAVGATLNRNQWIDAAGEEVSFTAHGALDPAPLDSSAFFSSAGPNVVGTLKPDLVAPGAFVIGAMAENADPREPGSTHLFADPGVCVAAGHSPACLVTDDFHGVAAGTSMAAPLVAGAIALLFERDPTLDQFALRALLQAGARPLAGAVPDEQQVGAGELDLARTLEALAAGDGRRLPGAGSRVVLSGSVAHPDPSWPLEGLLQIRDDEGRIADGFDESRIGLSIERGSLVERPVRLAPGLYRFSLAADAGAGGYELVLVLNFDGRTLATERVPIAVDPALATGVASARGGCSISAPAARRGPSYTLDFVVGLLFGFLLFKVLRSIRALRAARTARRPDRRAARHRRARYGHRLR